MSCAPAIAFKSRALQSGSIPGCGSGTALSNSVSGGTVTWVEAIWELPPGQLPAVRTEAIGRQLAAWEGPATEARPEPKSLMGAVPSARGRVRPGDLDEHGRFSLAAFVHRFTDALLQASAAIGMTGAYMKAARRGFSTFELALRVVAAPRLGDPYLIETGIAHLGGSSVRFVHRMSDPRTGEEFARLGQFGVQLDLDARRPAPLPEEIRTRAASLLLPFD